MGGHHPGRDAGLAGLNASTRRPKNPTHAAPSDQDSGGIHGALHTLPDLPAPLRGLYEPGQALVLCGARSDRPAQMNSAADTDLRLDAAGWLVPAPGIEHHPSPNHDTRPADEAPSLLVLHNISLPPGCFDGDAVIDFFLNRLDYNAHPWFDNIRDIRVSAHFLIRRNGTIIQFVPTTLRAWHAGVSHFAGRERCNDFSVGIEIEGSDTRPYTDAQYAGLRRLAAALRARHPIVHVRGHEHIAPGRKTDPGPSFDWARFAREGGWLTAQLP